MWLWDRRAGTSRAARTSPHEHRGGTGLSSTHGRPDLHMVYADRRFCTPRGGPWFRRRARFRMPGSTIAFAGWLARGRTCASATSDDPHAVGGASRPASLAGVRSRHWRIAAVNLGVWMSLAFVVARACPESRRVWRVREPPCVSRHCALSLTVGQGFPPSDGGQEVDGLQMTRGVWGGAWWPSRSSGTSSSRDAAVGHRASSPASLLAAAVRFAAHMISTTGIAQLKIRLARWVSIAPAITCAGTIVGEHERPHRRELAVDLLEAWCGPELLRHRFAGVLLGERDEQQRAERDQ